MVMAGAQPSELAGRVAAVEAGLAAQALLGGAPLAGTISALRRINAEANAANQITTSSLHRYGSRPGPLFCSRLP